jgi:K+ transporter
VPLALTQFVKHNRVLHQRVLLVTVVIEEAPRIADEDRVEVIEIIEGITRVILHFGFMQYPTIAEGLALASSQGKLPGTDLGDVTYYIGRETIIPSALGTALHASLRRTAQAVTRAFMVTSCWFVRHSPTPQATVRIPPPASLGDARSALGAPPVLPRQAHGGSCGRHQPNRRSY